MQIEFTIPGTLPTLNEYIKAERTNKFIAAKLKKDVQNYIAAYLPELEEPISEHVYVYFTWVRPDARTDKDNVAFSKKYILDAMQRGGVIGRDSWRLCTPYDKGFYVNKADPRTVVLVSTERL